MRSPADHVTLSAVAEMLAVRCEVRVLRSDLAATALTGLKPASAAGNGDIAFVKTSAHLAGASETKATLLIVPAGTALDEEALAARGVAAIAYSLNPRLDFSLAGELVAPRPAPTGVSPQAHIQANCELGADVSIAPGCVIGAASIGAGTVLGPGCIVGDGCVIGSGCLLQANVVIGAEGFGYERDERGYPVKFPHVGAVRIGDRVDVGAGTVIARGALGDTEISNGVKIDNLCHIAHNVHIGEDTMVVAHAMIGGSSRIGERVWIGPGALISNGLTVGDDAFVTLGAVVTRDVAPSERVTGNFAVEHRKFLAHLREIR